MGNLCPVKEVIGYLFPMIISATVLTLSGECRKGTNRIRTFALVWQVISHFGPLSHPEIPSSLTVTDTGSNSYDL